ncbi:MAG: hypothetical protein IJ661_04690 [Lachnospiraceae bacterium]|nr:hypothetical protein [Lachnospiraceae bacterium]
MILAQYTIRSKQDYIFKTNRVLEIVGASENIAKIWDVLFETAAGIPLKFKRLNEEFNMEDIKKKFSSGELNMVELFCGGGNETILFDTLDEEYNNSSLMKLNKAFSRKILEDYPGMVPMVSYIIINENSPEYVENYSNDYHALMAESDRKKNIMTPQWDVFTVPFAMMDRETFEPYSVYDKKLKRRLSYESYSKYKVGERLRDENNEIKLFDSMVTRKGKESLLAVVHADGNNMGAKIMGMLNNETSYDKAIKIMREFTKTTQDCFEKWGEDALKKCQDNLKKRYEKQLKNGRMKGSSLSYRKIIGSGDDMTFICNARFVMDYVKAYLDAVQNYQSNHSGCQWSYSSCAGICIFHSHYPFSRAYSIAEQACDDGAKKKVHKENVVEQGWMDYHFIHSGIGGQLDEIRKTQGTDRCIARPWLVSYNKDDKSAEGEKYSYEKLLRLKNIFEKKRDAEGKESKKGTSVARTSIKTIGSAFERSESAAQKELVSLYGHTPGLKADVEKIYSNEKDFLKALYDFAEIYDLWYTEVR